MLSLASLYNLLADSKYQMFKSFLRSIPNFVIWYFTVLVVMCSLFKRPCFSYVSIYILTIDTAAPSAKLICLCVTSGSFSIIFNIMYSLYNKVGLKKFFFLLKQVFPHCSFIE